MSASEAPLTAYEALREANIERNRRMMIALGLETEGDAPRSSFLTNKKKTTKAPAGVKRAREAPAAARAPTRGSKRLAGEIAEYEGGLEGDVGALGAEGDFINDDEDGLGSLREPLKRASKHARLTTEQAAKLNALEEASAGPLTPDELEAIDLSYEYIASQRTAGSWKAHAIKGTCMWEEKRVLLKEAADMFGLRWPSWLDKIQGALPKMGGTPNAQHQTMFAIERAACGMGLPYKHWPYGVGVLLATDELADGEAPPNPRVLTLGSDTESFRREGQRIEARYGRDSGNGWVYNHALGKLRLYQELLLETAFGKPESPSAPSIAELEAGGDEL